MQWLGPPTKPTESECEFQQDPLALQAQQSLEALPRDLCLGALQWEET